MIKVETPLVVAAIGVIGVSIGAFIQYAIAKFNKRSERLLSFETKLAEIRIEAYLELARYVVRREHKANRNIGIVSPRNIAPTATSALAANSEGADSTGLEFLISERQAAELAALGSTALRLLFACWELAYARHHSAVVASKFVEAVKEIPAYAGLFKEDDVKNLSRLKRLTGQHSHEFAEKVCDQIRRELLGSHPWSRPRTKVRNYLSQRRRDRARWAESDFVEENSDRWSNLIDAAQAEMDRASDMDADSLFEVGNSKETPQQAISSSRASTP